MNRLQRLLLENRGKSQGLLRIDNKAADEATLYLYGAIVSDNFWGDAIAAIDFVKELASVTAKTIHLRIDSPGGEIFAGQSMAQAIREHPANVIAHIDGLAASAASWVALAADEVLISAGGMVMIHQAQGMAFGNSNDFRETADLLDKLDAVLVSGYVKETGQSENQITDWMAAETWFNADEAVKHGFADRVASSDKAASNQVCNPAWNLAAYEHAPEIVAIPKEDSGVSPAPTFEPDLSNTEHLRRRLTLVEKQAA